jgi:phosphoglycerol transferase MdoB-like AlkP superfamily enzyme
MKNRILSVFTWLFLLGIVVMMLLRIIFWLYNYRFFPSVSAGEQFWILYAGSRFDASALAYVLLPSLLLYVLYGITTKKVWWTLLIWMMHLFFWFVIIATLFDAGFYSFSFSRSDLHTLSFVGDSFNVFRSAPLHYAALIIVGIFLLLIVHQLLKRIYHRYMLPSAIKGKQLLLLPPVAFVLIIALRGLNARPISPLSVSLYTNANFASVVTNNIQTTIYSLFRKTNTGLYQQQQYMPLIKAQQEVPFVHQFATTTGTKQNVVIFILESFARAYLEYGNQYKAATPFLDSIMANSFYCTNAYANGAMSVNGVQAILSGIPAVYDYNIDNSDYYQNFTRAMPVVFKEHGYGTYFYYGAGKDHFGLEKLSKRFGVDHYLSEDDYNNPSQHNGVWGIHDSAFYRFAVDDLAKRQEPFFATVFNVSSHYPYVIPKEYRSKFPKGATAASQAISYVDLSLQRFFEQAQKSNWFQNTLFVFVADHWNKEDGQMNAEGSGRYQIPLFIYKPDGSLKKTYSDVTDQISVFPTLMQLTGYQKSFNSFGQSMVDSNRYHFTVAVKQWPSLLLFTDTNFEYYFDVVAKRSVGFKLLGSKKDSTGISQLEYKAKAFVQHYNYLFANNKLADTNHLPQSPTP